MSKLIRVEDNIYYELVDLKDRHDTFNDVVKRLIAIVKPLQQAADILGPSHYLMERPRKEVKQDAVS